MRALTCIGGILKKPVSKCIYLEALLKTLLNQYNFKSEINIIKNRYLDLIKAVFNLEKKKILPKEVCFALLEFST